MAAVPASLRSGIEEGLAVGPVGHPEVATRAARVLREMRRVESMVEPCSSARRGSAACVARRAWRRSRSGGEPLERPAVVGAAVPQPVVQAVLAALPELDRLGIEAEADPVR